MLVSILIELLTLCDKNTESIKSTHDTTQVCNFQNMIIMSFSIDEIVFRKEKDSGQIALKEETK